MAGHVRVAISSEMVGHDHGHWCTECLLVTGVRAFMVVTFGDRMSMHVVAWCTECGGRDIVCDPVDDAHSC